jgi:hypothetical protein
VGLLRGRNWIHFAASAGSGSGPPPLSLGLFTGGAILDYATVGGTLNNVNPGGSWPASNIGRLYVDTTAGNEIWTGLASTGLPDGYGVLIKIVAGVNYLQLDTESAGSTAANRFDASGDVQLFLGQQAIMVYNAGSLNIWSL